MRLAAIRDDADARRAPEVEAKLPALTADNRTTWAEARERYFSEGPNRRSLDVIEAGLFVIVLDETAPATWNERAAVLFHNDGHHIWCGGAGCRGHAAARACGCACERAPPPLGYHRFDKNFCLIVSENGHAGVNGEHSWADAPVMAVRGRARGGARAGAHARCAETRARSTWWR